MAYSKLQLSRASTSQTAIPTSFLEPLAVPLHGLQGGHPSSSLSPYGMLLLFNMNSATVSIAQIISLKVTAKLLETRNISLQWRSALPRVMHTLGLSTFVRLLFSIYINYWQLSSGSALYVCSNGTTLSNQCLNEGQTLNISSTLSIYKRQASTINARSNWTILSVPEIGPPSQVTDTNISALRSAISWLLDYEAAGIPPSSAFMTVFWSDRLQLSSPDWSDSLILAFQSMFVVPMRFFSDINYGNVQIQSSPTNVYSGVPPEFTTTASLATPRSKIVITPVCSTRTLD